MADDRENTNVLVLAGPGSGKTRVLVHRIAYLVAPGALIPGASWPSPTTGMRCIDATVTALVSWSHKHSDPQYEKQLQCDDWEVVVPELVFEPL